MCADIKKKLLSDTHREWSKVHTSCIVFLKESDNGAEKMLASVHHEVEDDDLTTCELLFFLLPLTPKTSLGDPVL